MKFAICSVEVFKHVSGVRHVHGNDAENASANMDVDSKSSTIELVNCLDIIHMALMHKNRTARASTISKIQNQAMAVFNFIIIGLSPRVTQEYDVPMNEFTLVDKLQESLV